MRRAYSLLDTKPADAIAEFERASSAGANEVDVKKGLGAAHLRLKEYDKALALMKEVVAKRPNDVQSLLDIAKIDVYQKHFDEARTILESSLRLNPPNATCLLLYAALARTPAQGKAGLDALKRLDKVQSAAFIESAEYVFAQASLSAAAGDVASAEEALKAATSRSSIDPTLAVTIAGVSLVDNRTRLAEWLLARASNTPTAKEDVHWALAELALSQRHLSLANAAISKLAIYFKPDPKALLLLADLQELKSDYVERAKVLKRVLEVMPTADVAQRRDVEMKYAIALQRSGQTDQSKKVVVDLLTRNPGFPPAQILLTGLLLSLQRPDEAIALAERASKNQPMRTEAYRLLVAAHLMKKDNAAAEAAARRYVAASESSPDSIALLANLLIQENHLPAALREVESGLVRHPNQVDLMAARIALTERTQGFAKAEAVALDAAKAKNPRILSELASLYERNKRLEQAIGVYREIAKAQPQALVGLSSLEVQVGRLTDAIASVSKLADADPDNLEALLRLGMLEERTGHKQDAIKTYERVLFIAPESAVALNNLASLLSEIPGQTKLAVELAQKAADLAPKDDRIADTLGWAMVKNGKPADQGEAVRLLKRSSEGLHTPESYYHYGSALAAHGKWAEAKASLEKALSAKDKELPAWRTPAQKLLEDVQQQLAKGGRR
jgi:tetratricopeptide (TPR) repeat protein